MDNARQEVCLGGAEVRHTGWCIRIRMKEKNRHDEAYDTMLVLAGFGREEDALAAVREARADQDLSYEIVDPVIPGIGPQVASGGLHWLPSAV